MPSSFDRFLLEQVIRNNVKPLHLIMRIQFLGL